jgi:hypothetical protein
LDVVLVVVGGLIGGGFGLGGAWIAAGAVLRSTRISGQLSLIATTRARLVELDAPLLDLVWTIREIVLDQGFLYGDDTVEKQRERHALALTERRAELTKVAAKLSLEPGAGELESTLAELWRTYTRHTIKLNARPNPVYQLDDQTAAVKKIENLVSKVESILEGRIADLDDQAEAVIALRPERPGRWLMPRKG